MLIRTQTRFLEPSLENLSSILRNECFWPEGFHWDYSRELTCAIGLSYALWGHDATSKIRSLIPVDEDNTIFFVQKAGWWPFRSKVKVQPEQVADAIDHYLERLKYVNDNSGNSGEVA